MTNIQNINKLLKDHYNGVPWIDITIAGTLKTLTAKQAAIKIDGLNSVWQIVNHMISWRNALIARVKDKPARHPDNNFFWEVKDTTAKAWKDTLKKFEKSQKEIIVFLGKQKDSHLEKISPASGYSYYELVMAIIIHDTYHLGQIVLIKKMIDES
ncbi:MAG TPA: DinB family protein [Ignavibacteria bacterium]|nr:DinB family protein [Ignavibacteria bacterium]HMQ98986.1 DinB family protein [Ignavibacteria bacterium]